MMHLPGFWPESRTSKMLVGHKRLKGFLSSWQKRSWRRIISRGLKDRNIGGLTLRILKNQRRNNLLVIRLSSSSDVSSKSNRRSKATKTPTSSKSETYWKGRINLVASINRKWTKDLKMRWIKLKDWERSSWTRSAKRLTSAGEKTHRPSHQHEIPGSRAWRPRRKPPSSSRLNSLKNT